MNMISNQQAKTIAIDAIQAFHNNSDNPSSIMRNVIKPTVSESMKLVVCLHLIIMFKDIQYLRDYLENIYDLHGSVLCDFMINHSIQHEKIFISSEHCVAPNSINALTCCLLWNNDSQVIRLLIQYGADINTTNEVGLYSVEISEQYPYYNHLNSFIHHSDACVVYGKRTYNEFIDSYNEINMIAGEMPPRINWQRPSEI